MKHATDTEARFYRTHRSSRDAFPSTCAYACSLERHKRRLSVDEKVAIVALLCALVWAIWG